MNHPTDRYELKTLPKPQPVEDWKEIDWKKVEVRVFKLQKRIYRASRSGNISKVHKLQRLLYKSWSAKVLAVRRVTQDNKGKKTAGIDGIKSVAPKERLKLVEELGLDGKCKSTRRIWIPKPGKDEKRPLGIPTMKERAKQALLKMALEPEWEAKFEPNSYGFRPGRSCHDAIEAIWLGINKKAKYVLDADIAKCFDRIDHNALLRKLNNTPTVARQIRAWLESGVLDKGDWFPTDEGTPQGGVISPLLANVALHGMEEAVKQFAESCNFIKAKGKRDKRSSLNFVRYADDFVIIHEDLNVIEKCKEIIAGWLSGIGLELKPSKTRICHTLKNLNEEKAGFDFLGFTIRQFPVGKHHNGRLGTGYKTIVKPSEEKVKLHYQKIADTITALNSTKQSDLISILNPIIRGWCNYYASVCSKEIFSDLKDMVQKRLFRWAKRRHPHKSWDWVSKRYWHNLDNDRWVFSTPSNQPNDPTCGNLHLIKHSWTPIVRHTKVKGDVSPYNGDWRYWSQRMGKYVGIPSNIATLMKKQKGKCSHCGLYFKDGDIQEIDHIIPKKLGGKSSYKNLQLLHRHCHHVKSASDGS